MFHFWTVIQRIDCPGQGLLAWKMRSLPTRAFNRNTCGNFDLSVFHCGGFLLVCLPVHYWKAEPRPLWSKAQPGPDHMLSSWAWQTGGPGSFTEATPRAGGPVQSPHPSFSLPPGALGEAHAHLGAGHRELANFCPLLSKSCRWQLDTRLNV